MTTPTRTEGDGTSLTSLLRRAAIPATAEVVVDLESRRPVGIRVATSEATEPLDAVTIARVLNALAQGRGRPDAPVIFDVPIGTLLGLTAAGLFSEHPLIVSLEADDLLEHPAQSLRLVERVRELGWEIGLHGVGSNDASLASIGVFEPSLVTIDGCVLHDPLSPTAEEMLHTVTAFRHATGATVMADHLDSDALCHTARSLGATIGRGRAVPSSGAEMPSELDYTLDLFVSPRLPDHSRSPYELSVQRHQPQRAHAALLVSASRKIERAATTAGRSSIVLAAFQHRRRITPGTQRSFAGLVGRAELIMMAAAGLRHPPMPGVSWANLPRHDHLRREWVLLLMGPMASVLLSAREVRRSDHRDREFDYVLSFDRDLVAHAARSLLTRLPRRNAA